MCAGKFGFGFFGEERRRESRKPECEHLTPGGQRERCEMKKEDEKSLNRHL